MIIHMTRAPLLPVFVCLLWQSAGARSLDIARQDAIYHCVTARKPGDAPSRQCVWACARLPEIRALLDTIAYSEGTYYGPGRSLHDQYATVVFGNQMTDFVDHPRTIHRALRQGKEVRSSAAGRYQLLGKMWDVIAPSLGLASFGPCEQDYAAIFLIAQRKQNISALLQNMIEPVIYHIHRIWPSLPSKSVDKYGQVRTTMDNIKKFYAQAMCRHSMPYQNEGGGQ
jgi:muramidase (phage lysozyme)